MTMDRNNMRLEVGTKSNEREARSIIATLDIMLKKEDSATMIVEINSFKIKLADLIKTIYSVKFQMTPVSALRGNKWNAIHDLLDEAEDFIS